MQGKATGRRASLGNGLGWVALFCSTLVAPVAPSPTGCKPCVYGRCGTRAPLNREFLSQSEHDTDIFHEKQLLGENHQLWG